MDTNLKASNGGGITMTENKKAGEVVVVIPGGGHDLKARINTSVDFDSLQKEKVSAEDKEYSINSALTKSSAPMSCPPEIGRPESLNGRKTLISSGSLKSKSRFGEPSLPLHSIAFEEFSSSLERQIDPHKSSNLSFRNMANLRTSAACNKMVSPTCTSAATTTTLQENFMRAVSSTRSGSGGCGAHARGEDEDNQDEEIYKKVTIKQKLKDRKVKLKVCIQWVLFICIMGCLAASLTVDKLKYHVKWGLEIWKWCVLIMVTFSGMWVTNCFVHLVVFLIERNYLFKKKVLYFVHGLKKSVQVCIWLCLVLVTWILLFNHIDGLKRRETHRILGFVTWTLVSMVIASFLWFIKTLMLKILASSTFHVTRFFDRIQDSLVQQYILQTLSGPPLKDSDQKSGKTNSTPSELSFRRTKKGKEGKEKEVIDINKLYKMKKEKVSAWTMKVLVDLISTSRLSTISNALDESFVDDGEGEHTDKEITSEMEAFAAAFVIFKNVSHYDPDCDCWFINEMDLKRFMLKEEVDIWFQVLADAEISQPTAVGVKTRRPIAVTDTLQIDKIGLTEWVVKVFKDRKTLAHALSDTKTAVKQLNKLLTGILIVVMLVVWLLVTEVATTKVLLFFSSQLVVAVFMFGNTCRTIFEAIIFVFVMHPFDVGDRCVIDGVQMVVEEMNILTTVFLKFDNTKIYYPNSLLATKPISNFYRSSDMGDCLEFSIDFMTPLEKIGTLKEKIQKYLETNCHYWHPNHNVILKEIENVNKIKMALFFNHKINFQDYMEKSMRKSELVTEMKKIFDELGIKYNLLPQEVHLIKSATQNGNAK